MKSKTTADFRKLFASLPESVKQKSRQAYTKFKQDPFHPSLRFKQVHPNLPIYSVRISKYYRAVGVRKDKEIVWFWIGSHADYDKLLSQL
ncbi:MAG: hypothetical protein QNJ38_22840 [Prochloraceae cyanobacterium]|nr:hypothetical protein [Prochloraceae cyanobacterium]